MDDYALLLAPSVNRVYADRGADLAAAELEVFALTAMSTGIGRVETTTIGGVPYLTFTGPPLTDRDLALLSNLSAGYALFRRDPDGALRPRELTGLDRFDDDLITIQKYPGKTNEQFTKLLMNVTVLSGAAGAEMLDRRLDIFDPLCGRGTTLNQALMYGWNAAGMEIDGKHVDSYRGFLETWLRRKRLKHHTSLTPVRRTEAAPGGGRTTRKQLVARRLEVRLSADKTDYKAGDQQVVTVVHGDTGRAGEFFKARTFDAIVADAPYGVVHGSRGSGGTRDTGGGRGSAGARRSAGARGSGETDLSRRPMELLQAALPGWVRLLRPGGAIGLSWNTYGASRAELVNLLVSAGLQVRSGGPYERFEHRVDQAITRDLIVGIAAGHRS